MNKEQNTLDFILSWNNRGNDFYKLGKYREAIECYDKALELDPDIAGVWYNKASCFYNLQKYQEAIECHHKIVEIDPSYGDYHKEWCVICGKIILVGIDASICAINEPGNSKYYHDDCNMEFLQHLDQCSDFQKLGKYREAIECYDKALELDPDIAGVWYNKAFCLQSIGKEKDAKQCYDKALELDPDIESKP